MAARMARCAWWSRDRIVPRRDAEDLGDDGGLVPEVVAEHQDRTLLRLQPLERAIHDVAIDDAHELVGRDLILEPEDLHAVATPLATSMLDAHVGEHALKPEVEPVRIAEVRQVAPGDHQRVLQGILGPVDVVQDPPRDGEQAIDATAEQVDEGDLVTALRRRSRALDPPPALGWTSIGDVVHCSGGWCADLVGKSPRHALHTAAPRVPYRRRYRHQFAGRRTAAPLTLRLHARLGARVPGPHRSSTAPSRQPPRRGEPPLPALDQDRVGCSSAPNTCRARHCDESRHRRQ